MASIGSDPGGRKRILFVAPDKKRKTLRLGKVSRKAAENVCHHVEALLVAKLSGQPLARQTAAWLGEIGLALRDKLAAVGLVESVRCSDLGAFLDTYILSRPDVQPATLAIWRQPCRNLVEFFGASKALREITPGDAQQFAQWLATQDLAGTTVAKRLAFARTFFHTACLHRFLDENPFVEVAIPTPDVSARQFFVGLDRFNQVLALADPTWRTILSLARLGGLRCPSEVLSLEWRHIDWQRGRVIVPSPKTNRYPGKASREIPLFGDLRPYLEAAREVAEPAATHVVGGGYLARAQGPEGWRNCNLHTAVKRLVLRAGLEPWPRLLHNLRSSRETELLRDFPPHVVARWMGHDVRVSMKHYAQVTDDDFERAAQKAAQHLAESDVTATKQPGQNRGDTVCFSAPFDGVPSGERNSSGGRGIPIPQETGQQATLPEVRGTESGTLPQVLALLDLLTHDERGRLIAVLIDRGHCERSVSAH